MIDPWKFNPLTELGKEAGKLSEVPYLRKTLEIAPTIITKVKDIREEVKNGNKKLVDNSNELFL